MGQSRPLFCLFTFFSPSGIELGSYGPELAALSTRPPPRNPAYQSRPIIAQRPFTIALVLQNRPQLKMLFWKPRKKNLISKLHSFLELEEKSFSDNSVGCLFSSFKQIIASSFGKKRKKNRNFVSKRISEKKFSVVEFLIWMIFLHRKENWDLWG